MKRFLAVILVVLTASLLLMVLAAPLVRAGYTSWVEYVGNPVYDPAGTVNRAYYPCVIYDAAQFSSHGDAYYYKMWYGDTQSAQWEWVVYSNDGITWENPEAVSGIVAHGYHAKLVYIPGGYSATGGTYYYKMWYWDSDATIYDIVAMRTADSVDGVSWANDVVVTQDATQRLVVTQVPTVEWNSGTYGPVHVMYNPTAGNTGTDPFNYSFTMYYDGTTGGVEVIGLGYSADGNHWYRYGNDPVLGLGGAGEWDSNYVGSGTVIKESTGVWHMWYSGGQTQLGDAIGYASSADGLTWTKSADNPVLSKNDGVAWRNDRTYTPMVIYSPTRFDGHGPAEVYRMWFTGRTVIPASNYAIGTATRTSVSIAAAAGTGGSIDPSGLVSVAVGDDQSFTITPDAGYHVSDVLVDGVSVGAVTTYTFNGVTTSHTIGATFAVDAQAMYFAEGYTGAGFQEYLCLGNAGIGPVTVEVTYLFTDDTTLERSYVVPALSRLTVNVNSEVGPGRDVSIKCEATAPFVAERPMYFDYTGAGESWTGGTDAVGAATTSGTWYFAEGYTGPGFDEWVCVLNPGDVEASLTFNFQTQEDGLVVPAGTYIVPARSRATFKANDLLQGRSYQTSLKLESDQPVVAERPMYFNYQGTASWGWTGGHDVLGVPSLTRGYYFAEGTTRAGFEEWLTLQNPGSEEITVNAVYNLGAGDPVVREYKVPAGFRDTVFVADEVGAGQDVSVYLSSGSDFLAERPMYFDYQGTASWGWTGGHCVIGAVSAGTTWFFAEGYTGAGFEEWLCIQNPGDLEAAVQITYLPEEGALPVTRSHTVPAASRYTVYVNSDAGEGMSISSLLVSNQPVIVERPMYFNYNGVWTGGSDVVGFMP